MSDPTLSPEASKKINEISQELKTALHQYPNFPKEGILFVDFLPIFRVPDLFNKLVLAFKLYIDEKFKGETIDYVVGLESRGFLFGPTLALAINAGFVPVRKRGKLPGQTYKAKYSKEYGDDYFEIQKEAIPEGSTVLVVDDILATGGSAEAAGKLVLDCGATLLGFLFVMELDFLKGRNRLQANSFTLLCGQPKSLGSVQETDTQE